jgi:pyrroloquinoline quinone biosynthesis protein B
MHIRLLGTAAGGGFPQWNCNCSNCRGVRSGTVAARPRTQCSVAISSDGARWFLLGASPDVRVQIESFAPLLPRHGVRGTGIEGVLLSNADLDHTLGLLMLREGEPLVLHATVTIRQVLSGGLALAAVLASYCGLVWREPPHEPAPLCYRDGKPSGLSYSAFPVDGKPPRYGEGRGNSLTGTSIGYRLVDERTGGRLLVLLTLAAFDDTITAQLQDCDALLLDGTFWSDDEMQVAGVGRLRAAEMGHLPVGGPGGSLARIAPLPIRRRIYIHLNNTNPLLLEDSPERQAVHAAGVEVGHDGLELTL